MRRFLSPVSSMPMPVGEPSSQAESGKSTHVHLLRGAVIGIAPGTRSGLVTRSGIPLIGKSPPAAPRSLLPPTLPPAPPVLPHAESPTAKSQPIREAVDRTVELS